MRTTLPLAALALAGCSLVLDFSEVGLPCNEAGECKEGYTCDKDDRCMPDGAPSTLCAPACSTFDRCVKAKCQPMCRSTTGTQRGCAAGLACDPNAGTCAQVSPSTRNYGIPCTTDGDCTDGGTDARCLRPYGGGGGFCTRECSSDAQCGGRADKCLEYGAARENARICAPESFLPCVKESDCNPSGLSCGVYAFGQPKALGLMACRARLDGAAIGEKCNDVIKCTNGLCLPIGGTDFACTTPCRTVGDCQETAPPARRNDAACQKITLSPPPSSSLPAVRPQLCMYGPQSIADECSSSATCTADAPTCAAFAVGANTVSRCVPGCGSDSADACPSGTECRSAEGTSGGRYCGPPATQPPP